MHAPFTPSPLLRRVQRGLAGLVLACLPFSVSAQKAQDPVPASLRLDWTTLGYHAPFYYGVAQGIYERAGIRLAIEEGKGSASVAQLAASGNDDFGFSDATTVAQLIGKGLPGRVVMGILRGTTIAMYHAPGRQINTPQDLKGRKIAVCPGDAISVYIPPYLKSIGLKGDEVQQLSVDCTLKYTVVAQGRADAVMTYATAAKPLLQKVGIQNAETFTPGPDFYLPAHGIVVSEKLIRDKPELIRKFVAATVEAWQAAAKDPDGAVQAVIAARPLLKDEGAALKETLLMSLRYTDAPSSAGKPFGWQAPQDWDRALDILRQYSSLPDAIKGEQVYTNDFLGEK